MSLPTYDRPRGPTGAFLVRLPSPNYHDPAVSGQIVVAELAVFCPFVPQRLYWIHGMGVGEERGQHAHRALQQAMVAVHGKVDVVLDTGQARETFHLHDPSLCLIVPPGLWRDIRSLSQGAALLVLASAPYDEADYIREYRDFLAYKGVA